jgi:hypothetical protein
VARNVLLGVILAFGTCLPRPALGQPTTGLLALEPERVEIDLTFSGASIQVRAVLPTGYEGAVRLIGRPERQDLKKLGKRGGLLWMSVGDLTLEHVPQVYEVLSSSPLANLASPAVLEQWMLGYRYLLPEKTLDPALRSEFVRLKEHEGLFRVREGGLRPEEPAPEAARTSGSGAASGSLKMLRGTLALPASVPVGDYAVDLIGFEHGRATRLASATLHLEYVGTVTQLRRLAFDHGLAYGIVASLLAILVGLLTGFLFQRKSDEAH